MLYTAVIERCSDTNLFVGYVPGFPGAHSQRETHHELHANLREVIAMLLDDGEPRKSNGRHLRWSSTQQHGQAGIGGSHCPRDCWYRRDWSGRSEHIAIQLQLTDLKPGELHLADGTRKIVRYAGPVKIEMQGRDCVTGAAVVGDQVLLGAVPMELMDVIVHPRTLQLVPNPESPNVPIILAK
jgi:predicted RNase H-like HicB family nuclease